MKPPLSWLLRLYPQAWRDRYGQEFEALVDDKGNPWQHAADIFIEALKMRIALMNWKLITSFGLAGLIVAAAVSWQVPKRYVSQAVLQVVADRGTSVEDTYGRIVELQRRTLSRTSIATIMMRPDLDLYKGERAKKPLEDVIEYMKKHDVSLVIEAEPRGNARIFKISFAGNDPAKAAATVKYLVARTLEENTKVNGVPMKLEVIDSPSLPVKPTGSSPARITLLGLLLGLLAGVIAWWWRGGGAASGGTGMLNRHPYALYSLSALLIVFGYGLGLNIVPLPHTSRATVEFSTPDTRARARAIKPLLTEGLLASVSASGQSWYAVELRPDSGSRAILTVRYSNRFFAQKMLMTLISRLPEVTVIDQPTLPVDSVTTQYAPAILLVGVLLTVLTTASILRNRPRKTPSLQTA